LQLSLTESEVAGSAVPPGGSAEPAVAEPLPVPPPPLDPAAELAECRRRVLANGGDVEARRRLARLLVGRGELAQALEHYEAARAAAPEDPVLVLEHAETLVGLKKFDPAERELRRLLRFQPNNGAAFLQLGIASLRRGLYAQAEQELQRATELLPNVANAFFYRGEALNQLSRLDEAMEMLQRTVQLDPGNARAYYMMGILHDKKNQPNEAAALYRKAREVGAR
jgi:superkiller protein 3